ncbi:MAG: 30S ribosomal protein S16 [Planctomycetales bacterium]|nr:30S ribosomal protein S16 [Planctomycetales bacterium]
MAVSIRMKKMGRTHRAFFRICACDKRSPRDGRVLEELGTYDPSVPETDARAVLKKDRIDYWLGVGAQPSEKVAILIKKYGTNGTHVEAQQAALNRLSGPRVVPDPGPAASKPKSDEPAPAEETTAVAVEEAPAEETAATEAPAEEGAGEGTAS